MKCPLSRDKETNDDFVIHVLCRYKRVFIQ